MTVLSTSPGKAGGRPPCGWHQVPARGALASGVLRGFCEGAKVARREEQVSVAFPPFLPGGELPLSWQCPPRSLRLLGLSSCPLCGAPSIVAL